MRVTIDERGVTARGWLRRRALAWDDIRDYRLAIELHGAPASLLHGYGLIGAYLIAEDVARGARGDSHVRVRLALRGARTRLALDDAGAIARVLARIAAPAAAATRARFGPLAIEADAVRWGDRPPLPRAEVERIELFNATRVRLRVMARGKVWPYGSARTAAIPDLLGALARAEALGYPVARAVLS